MQVFQTRTEPFLLVDSKLHLSPVFLLCFNVFLHIETVWMHRVVNKQRKRCSFLSFSFFEPTLCLFFIWLSSSSLLSQCPGSSNVRPSCPGIRVCLKIAKLACYFPGSSALTLYPPSPPPPLPFLTLESRRFSSAARQPIDALSPNSLNTNPRQVRERLKTSLGIERWFSEQDYGFWLFLSLCSLFALSS